MTSDLQKAFYQEISFQLQQDTLTVEAPAPALQKKLARAWSLLKRTSLVGGGLLALLGCQACLLLTSFLTEVINQQDVLQF